MTPLQVGITHEYIRVKCGIIDKVTCRQVLGTLVKELGGHEAVVQLMIEHKAEVNATDQVPQA